MNDCNKINFPKEEEDNLDIIKYDNGIASIKAEDLIKLEERINCILNEYLKKMEASSKEKNIILKHNEILFKNKIFHSLLTQSKSLKELKDNEKYEIIIDLINFCDLEKKENININDKLEIFKKLYNNHITEKGELLLLCDFTYLKHIGNDLKDLLGEENKLKMLIKLYIVSKVPFLAIFTLKKIFEAKEKINILNEKILAYEIYEDLTLTKPISYTLNEMPKTIDYMYQMFQYEKFLNILHPGKSFKVEVKEIFWSDNIDFTMIIVDCNNEDILKQKNCAAIIIGQSYLNNFFPLNKKENLSLCR